MDQQSVDGPVLVEMISAMSETEIHQFIRNQSRVGRLSSTVRTLNRDALSRNRERRSSAEKAIRKLGFI